jgi:ABC-type sugar transport system ATPase subunit
MNFHDVHPKSKNRKDITESLARYPHGSAERVKLRLSLYVDGAEGTAASREIGHAVAHCAEYLAVVSHVRRKRIAVAGGERQQPCEYQVFHVFPSFGGSRL